VKAISLMLRALQVERDRNRRSAIGKPITMSTKAAMAPRTMNWKGIWTRCPTSHQQQEQEDQQVADYAAQHERRDTQLMEKPSRSQVA
jgi:hypothetical protein